MYVLCMLHYLYIINIQIFIQISCRHVCNIIKTTTNVQKHLNEEKSNYEANRELFAVFRDKRVLIPKVFVYLQHK